MPVIDHYDFKSIKVLEELSNNAVDRVAYTDDLVGRALKRRSKEDIGIDAPWSKLRGHFRLRPGELCLMGGQSGHGKSALINQWSLYAAQTGHRVGIMSLEMPAEYLFDQLASMAAVVQEPPESYLREFGQWMDDKIYIYDRADVISPTEALQALIGLRKHFGCDLIVLDCLMMCDLADDLDLEKKFTAQMAAIAKAFNCCIVLVHHMRKPHGGEGEKKVPTKHDFLGSSRIVNVASSVLILWVNKEKGYLRNMGMEVDDDEPDAKLVVAKQRFAQFEGPIGLYKHNTARVLCNNRQRQYRPIEIRQDNKEAFEHGHNTSGRGNGEADRSDTFTGFDGLDDGPLVSIRKRVSGDPFSHESCS